MRNSLLAVFVLFLCGTSTTALAIPSFTRKYHTSCTTCHTAFPKLTPFGEAFRRNNYRWPGDDAEATKYNTLPLGAEANKEVFPNAVWPDSIPEWVPLSMGVIGSAFVAPVSNSGAAAQNAGKPFFSMDNLAAEVHLWAGGTFDNEISYFTEVTLTQGGVSIEHAMLMFNDLLSGALGAHTLNLLVGQNTPNVTSFGIHSSYIVDPWITPVAVAQLFGGNGTFTPGTNELITLELNGVVAGRIDYNFGFSNGTNDTSPFTFHPPNNLYGHVGFKIGGLRLDGEGGGQASSKPWEETALTVDGWVYDSLSYYNNEVGTLWQDQAFTIGGNVRAQWQSLELDVGVFDQHHDHPDSSNADAWALTTFGELSYVVFPWLIPAFRMEYTNVRAPSNPNFIGTGGDGTTSASLLRMLPAVNFLIRPNIRVVLLADIESANSAPPGGWGGAGGFAAPVPGSSVMEFETLQANLLYAF